MAIATSPRSWGRYVAVGDSLSEGLADDAPGHPGEYIGWADRLALLLARRAEDHGRSFEYANLAVRGRLLADIVTHQLDAALELEPDLVSIWGGGNDCLRPGVDISTLLERLDGAVGRARATGADVLLGTPTNPKDAPVIGMTTGRFARMTAGIYTIAAQHDAYVTDMWGFTVLRDWRMWAPDRVHLSSEGHARLAQRAYAALGFVPEEGYDLPLPPGPVPSKSVVRRANVQWARDHAVPWVKRRINKVSTGDGRTGKRPVPTRLDPYSDPTAVAGPIVRPGRNPA